MRLGPALVLVAVAALAAGCGERAPPPATAPVPSPAAAATPARTGPRERPLALAIAHLRRDTLRREAFERWRLAELAKAKRSRTVAGALRRALLARHIPRAEHDRLRGIYE